MEFKQQLLEFSKWKDDNFLLHGNGTYYPKTSSQYFDVTKYAGPKEKPTIYFTLQELINKFSYGTI